jgi:hypothetical protein
MRIAIALAFVLSASAAQSQTWEELQAMRKETTVRVYELGGKGWAFADGKLLLVKDDELTILQGRRPIVIPKASIARVESRHRDPPWNGALIGALVGLAVMGAGAGQGCSSAGAGCVGGFMGGYAGLGALVDWQIVGRRTVYKAP